MNDGPIFRVRCSTCQQYFTPTRLGLRVFTHPDVTHCPFCASAMRIGRQLEAHLHSVTLWTALQKGMPTRRPGAVLKNVEFEGGHVGLNLNNSHVLADGVKVTGLQTGLRLRGGSKLDSEGPLEVT